MATEATLVDHAYRALGACLRLSTADAPEVRAHAVAFQAATARLTAACVQLAHRAEGADVPAIARRALADAQALALSCRRLPTDAAFAAELTALVGALRARLEGLCALFGDEPLP